MKSKVIFTVCAAMLAASLGTTSAKDVRFSMDRKKLSHSNTLTPSAVGSSSVEHKDIIYTIVVESTSLRDLENVTVEYNIYYEQPQIGSTERPPVKTLSGKHTIEKLPSYKKTEFDTDPIAMKEIRIEIGESLGVDGRVRSGSSSQIKDRVLGSVIKAYNSEGKLLGEYINPTNITSKRDWKKPE